jgi:hypothetical protein
LLAGSDGIVYTAMTEGDVESTRQRLSSQPWVAGVQSTPRNGATAWTIGVTDAHAAKKNLLRLLLADERAVVTAFGRKEYQLEDAFISLVEGTDNDHG